MRQINFSAAFDMRAPDWGAPRAELYAAAVEMAAFADRIGLNGINLMEHHGSEDGYLPQPFLLASAMAAVTKTIQFSLGAVLLPLHDPVMVAEQVAILDLISGGRCRIIFGAGYVPSEFAMFNTSTKDRAKRLDAGIEIVLRALRGERFEKDGRPIFVRPLPTRDPADIILAGGAVPASAKRAARFDIGLGPMNPDIVDVYLAECERLGQQPRTYFRPVPGMPLGVHLCEDPEAGWQAIERHAVHVITEYAKWAEGMPGGLPINPLGPRAMYLFDKGGDTGFRIHGTIHPESIGTAASSGCIRMLNKEVIELYELTKVGTKVIVI